MYCKRKSTANRCMMMYIYIYTVYIYTHYIYTYTVYIYIYTLYIYNIYIYTPYIYIQHIYIPYIYHIYIYIYTIYIYIHYRYMHYRYMNMNMTWRNVWHFVFSDEFVMAMACSATAGEGSTKNGHLGWGTGSTWNKGIMRLRIAIYI